MVAAGGGHVEGMKLFIDKGPEVNHTQDCVEKIYSYKQCKFILIILQFTLDTSPIQTVVSNPYLEGFCNTVPYQ